MAQCCAIIVACANCTCMTVHYHWNTVTWLSRKVRYSLQHCVTWIVQQGMDVILFLFLSELIHFLQRRASKILMFLAAVTLASDSLPVNPGSCSTADRSNRTVHSLVDGSAVGQLSSLSSRTKWQQLPAGDTLRIDSASILLALLNTLLVN